MAAVCIARLQFYAPVHMMLSYQLHGCNPMQSQVRAGIVLTTHVPVSRSRFTHIQRKS